MLNKNPDFATGINDTSQDLINESRQNLRKNSDEDSDGEINVKNIIR